MNVILIGYRATGKSTIARHLAKKLKMAFVDTDALIEEAAGKSIKDLIAERGWPAFREKEKEAVLSLSDRNLCIIATGGGVILAEDNRTRLQEAGIVVYLKTPLSDILERLERDGERGEKRPRFTDGRLDAETVAEMNRRAPLYEACAHFTVDTDGKSVVRVTDDIYEYLLETGAVSEINKLKKKRK